MRNLIAVLLLAGSLVQAAESQTTRYLIRADGLACAYCAYGVEKKLMQIHGVQSVDINLKQGLVIVDTARNVQLTEAQMRQLLADAGFSFKRMTRQTALENKP